MSWQIYILRFYFKSISLFIPKYAGLKSFKLFQKVRIKTIRKREEGFYKEVHHFKVSSIKEDLLCYEIGSENKNLVFLLHGWESNAAAFPNSLFNCLRITTESLVLTCLVMRNTNQIIPTY